MFWHSSSWPGLLGLLHSREEGAPARCLAALLQDWKVYQEARSNAKNSPFLRALVNQSPFATTWVRELAELVAASPDLAEDTDLLAGLQRVVGGVWQGWGHSKLVEDGFQQLRTREG
eukprot:6192733-Lingulodinium_polyedra.AAC.1